LSDDQPPCLFQYVKSTPRAPRNDVDDRRKQCPVYSFGHGKFKNVAIFSGYAFVCSFAFALVAKQTKSQRQFCLATLLFASTDAVPIGLIMAIALVLKALHPDLPSMLLSQGVAYCVVYAMFSNHFRWSFGQFLLAHDEDLGLSMSINDHARSNDNLIISRSVSGASTGSRRNYTDLLRRIFDPIYYSFLPLFTPMGMAGVIGILIGISPARAYFVDDSESALNLIFFSPVSTCGFAAIPLMLVLLGARLFTIRGTLDSTLRKSMMTNVVPDNYPSYKLTIGFILAMKLVIMPLLVNITVLYTGPAIGGLLHDRNVDTAFLISTLAMATVPTSMELWEHVMQQFDGYERQTGIVVYWTHLGWFGLSFVWVPVWLYIVDKLQQTHS